MKTFAISYWNGDMGGNGLFPIYANDKEDAIRIFTKYLGRNKHNSVNFVYEIDLFYTEDDVDFWISEENN